MYRKLKVNGYIDPRLTTNARNQSLNGVIRDDKVVTPFGELIFEEPNPYQPGTKVVVGITYVTPLYSFFHCVSENEIAAEQEKQKILEDVERFDEELRLRKLVLEAEEFNTALNLPFKWHTGRKAVISGLSESSDGSGRNRRSVIHVLVEEEIKFGRLKRMPGQFLCGADAGKELLDNRVSLTVSDDGTEYAHKVTCKGCITRAEKLREKY